MNPLEFGDGTWSVKSSSIPNHYYHLKMLEGELTCECKGFFYRQTCRHVKEVKIYMAEQEKIDMNEEELLKKSTGIYTDNKGAEVLVEEDKLDPRKKTLFVKSGRLFDEGKPTWIPRKELTVTERKKLLKEAMTMEKTFIEMHQYKDEFLSDLNDSDLFMYHKMLSELQKPQS